MVKDVVKNKKVIIFGLPGAFTSVCSSKHLPEYVKCVDKFKQAGVDKIICTAVNDAFVMQAWGEQLDKNKSVELLADGDASFHEKMGLLQNMPLIGVRSLRYSIYAEDGVIKVLNIEEPGGSSYKVSGPDHMINDLTKLKSEE